MTNSADSTLEFKSSGGKLAVYLLIAFLFFAISLYVLSNAMGQTGADRIAGLLLAVIGFAFALTASWNILSRLRHKDTTIVTISPDGIRDTRIGSSIIPWTQILDIGIWSSRGNSYVVLQIDADFEKSLDLTLMTQWTRVPNKLLGADGLCINPMGLDVSFSDLHNAIDSYWETHSKQQNGI